MKLGIKLLALLLAVAVLPVLFLTRYGTSYFHQFTKSMQEAQMEQAARLVGELHLTVSDPEQRQLVMDTYAKYSGRRYRFYDATGEVNLDAGEVGDVDFGENNDVKQAFETGEYSARWWLMPDRSRLYFFTSIPVMDVDGHVLGVAQVIEHTGRITKALMRLHEHQVQGVWWIALAAVGVAVVFSWLLTQRLRKLRLAAIEFASTGKIDGFAMNGRDEIADLASGFREMADELQRRQAYNRDFVLTTLHELKTPLTAMHGAADILQTRESLAPEDRKRFAGNIRYQSDRLLELVEELHTLTSLDVDLPSETKQSIDPGTWLTQVLERIQPALTHPVVLESQGEAVNLQMNAKRMEQVLVNILQNADRYHQGAEPIRIHSLLTSDQWRVEVRDDGPGIAPENLSRIFDRYFSTVPRDHVRSYGRGLGLAVVKRIIDHHGGTVFAHNPEEGGATVGFQLYR
jgi:signal transduction histidine kinase